MSNLLHFSEHRLQEVALTFMAIVYTIRLIWLFRWRGGRERQAKTGRPDTSRSKGAVYSLFNIFMPWAMESTRKKPLFYLQFGIFHMGVVAALTLSFVIPYAPGLLAENIWLVWAFQALTGAACVVGCLRMIRRIARPVMRKISTPDDYFSLALLTVWFFVAVLAAPNSTAGGERPLLTFFMLTAFFIVYVPFSKISHYLYYPFARYWLGRTLGHRGVYPLQRGARLAPETSDRARLELFEIKEG